VPSFRLGCLGCCCVRAQLGLILPTRLSTLNQCMTHCHPPLSCFSRAALSLFTPVAFMLQRYAFALFALGAWRGPGCGPRPAPPLHACRCRTTLALFSSSFLTMPARIDNITMDLYIARISREGHTQCETGAFRCEHGRGYEQRYCHSLYNKILRRSNHSLYQTDNITQQRQNRSACCG